MIHVKTARLEKAVKTHWEDTILKPRSLDEIKPFITDQQYKSLKATDKATFRFWGDTENNRSIWEKMNVGDLVLFYGDNRFHAKGYVGTTFQSDELAKYFWPDFNENGPWRNIYTIKDLTGLDILFKDVKKFFKRQDGKPRQADIFRGSECLTNQQVDEEFLDLIEEGWSSTEDDAHTRRGVPREAIIPKAQIYEVTFTIDGKNMIYVGQDSKCEETYYGSSLVIYHFKKLYGPGIFKKRILKEVQHISKGEINDLETKYIKKSKQRIDNLQDWFSINYTGENQRFFEF